jgi:hypothetical protein
VSIKKNAGKNTKLKSKSHNGKPLHWFLMIQ